MILLDFLKRGSTLRGATLIAPKSWRQNYLTRSHFEDDSSPYISRSDPPKWISSILVLYKLALFD
jgi:hypothetical protein